MDFSIWRKSLLNFYGLRYGRTRIRESILLTIKKYNHCSLYIRIHSSTKFRDTSVSLHTNHDITKTISNSNT